MTEADGGYRLSLPVSSRDRIQGLETAAIAVVEYIDYQCCQCATAHAIVCELQQQLGEQVCFVFRHFPLVDIHPHAQHAAEAVEAASAQGKFWEMHNCLLEHQQALDDGHLVEYALALGLSVSQFLKELSEDLHVERVREDVDSGKQSGVTSTPTFFINSHRYDGGLDRLSLRMAIVAALANNSDS